ncbi:MAG: hypothetical protein LBC80_02745 [Treponema sp.]|jgi:hypothetical protein|nr:hypothetical protein [Treponema sp.]
MKSFMKFIGFIVLAAVIVFPMAARGLFDGVGTAPAQTAKPGVLTITGLEEYENHYIYAEKIGLTEGEKPVIAAAYIGDGFPTQSMSIAGVLVTGGKAEIPVWLIAGSRIDIEEEAIVHDTVTYTGTGDAELFITIWVERPLHHWHFNVATGTASVRFVNGSASTVFIEYIHEE